MKRSTIMARIFFGLLLIASFGCTSEAAPGGDKQGDIAASPVDTLVISTTSFVDTFEVMGTADPLESVHVSSDLPGRILAASFDEGDSIRRGQSLFRIDVEVDEAGLQALETRVNAAERELNRMQRLREEGLATAQQLDTAETELDNARQNLSQSQLSVSRNHVKSPISGFVAVRMADVGEYANPGSPLAEIIDFDTIVVNAQVPESEVRHVNKDRTIDVYFPALDQTVEGTIHRTALRATETSRTFRVEIRVDNQAHRIRPGMRARLHFERETYDDVIMIPRDAVLEGFRGREAMIVTGDETKGRAETRTITLGPGAGNYVVVTDGLEAGQRVILRGHRGLVDGGFVEVIDEAHQGRTEDDS